VLAIIVLVVSSRVPAGDRIAGITRLPGSAATALGLAVPAGHRLARSAMS
jgi:hypothetical protein